MTTTNHTAPGSGLSQNAAILAALIEHNGKWVSMITLHRASGSMAVHSRIADLRLAGHTIKNKSVQKGRMKHSSYKLEPQDSQPLEL
jgi:hypothetical protein